MAKIPIDERPAHRRRLADLYRRAAAEGNRIHSSNQEMSDPPVPRMALKFQGEGGRGSPDNPGGRIRGALPLPPPTEAGVMPPEDSRLWFFVPKSVQKGEDFIQDDTREWFEDRGRKVPIARIYLDHPRWVFGKTAETIRGQLYNGNIVSEVHLLARISAGMSEYPAWVPVGLSIKQLQSDVGYRITKLTQGALVKHGKQAMEDFATRAPGQFLKFVSSTFVPKKIETEATIRNSDMDNETADALLSALAAELKRREREAKVITLQGGNDSFEPVNVGRGLVSSLEEMKVRSGQNTRLGYMPPSVFARQRIQPPGLEPDITDIVNLDPINPETEYDIEWD
jgi:hypothetical protein